MTKPVAVISKHYRNFLRWKAQNPEAVAVHVFDKESVAGREYSRFVVLPYGFTEQELSDLVHYVQPLIR